MNKKGFTLIELLVVIAIIGLLSTMAVFSLNSARTKARDAKRMSDMKMLSTAMEMYASDNGAYTDAFGSSIAVGALLEGASGIEYNSAILLDLSTLKDPSGKSGCTGGSKAACKYSVNIAPSLTEWQVCFYLEKGAGNLDSGLNHVSAGGVMDANCK